MRKTTSGTARRSRAAVIGLQLLFLSGAAAAEDTETIAPRVRLREASAAAAVRRALQGATRRMNDPNCLAVLSDFHDLQGRPLEAVLAAAGLSAEAHFGKIFFYDGSDLSLCARPGVLAGTKPGSHVVHICAAYFVRKHKTNPYEAENLILHEMLHTLGLGENPPHPSEIRARIAARCGQ